jgi:hypothetical protein
MLARARRYSLQPRPRIWPPKFNAFLFLATHGPIFIASSSSATLIQLLVWIIPVSPLELPRLSHPSTRCEDNRYKVHTTLLA